jgi:ribosome-binding ATPase YchF (GTP1/OBG family)
MLLNDFLSVLHREVRERADLQASLVEGKKYIVKDGDVLNFLFNV